MSGSRVRSVLTWPNKLTREQATTQFMSRKVLKFHISQHLVHIALPDDHSSLPTHPTRERIGSASFCLDFPAGRSLLLTDKSVAVAHKRFRVFGQSTS